MGAEVRAASVEDAHAIADVHVASWQAAYAGQLPNRYLDGLSADNRTSTWVEVLSQEPPTAVFVIGADDHLMGFAAVGASRDDDAPSGQVGEVAAIYARDEAWGRGVGRQLMAKALQHLRATGFEDATLWVLDSNDRAIEFYEGGGWGADGATRQDTIGGQLVTEIRYRRVLAH